MRGQLQNKYNHTNGYRFANRFQNVTRVKYIKDTGSFSIIPSAGIVIERMQEDKQDAVKVEASRTGGYNTQVLLGVDINNKKWTLGINYSASRKQDPSVGQINERPELNIHLSYSL